MMPNKIGEPENSHNLGVQLADWSKKKFFFGSKIFLRFENLLSPKIKAIE